MQKKREEVKWVILKEVDDQIDIIKKRNWKDFKWIKTAYKGKVKEYAHYYRYEQTIWVVGRATTTMEISYRLELDSVVVLDMIDGLKKWEMGYKTHGYNHLQTYWETEAVANMNVIAHTNNKFFEEHFPKSHKAIKDFYSELYQWLKY